MAEPKVHSATGQPSGLVEEDGLEVSVNGMWLFLAGEIMFFGVLFTAYLIYSEAYPEAFAEASQHLRVAFGGVNTAILLTSSFTMALAVHAAQVANRRRLLTFLTLTIFFGMLFLGVKAVEYGLEIQEGLFPGPGFTFEGSDPLKAQLFFTLYFIMTGIHGLHMVMGLLALAILVFMTWRTPIITPKSLVPVELIGLYWHFVDIVWIFLFPTLYLIAPG